MHQSEPENNQLNIDDDSLYPHVNNDIEYGVFEDIVTFSATKIATHNIETQQMTAILIHAHMTIII